MLHRLETDGMKVYTVFRAIRLTVHVCMSMMEWKLVGGPLLWGASRYDDGWLFCPGCFACVMRCDRILQKDVIFNEIYIVSD